MVLFSLSKYVYTYQFSAYWICQLPLEGVLQSAAMLVDLSIPLGRSLSPCILTLCC